MALTSRPIVIGGLVACLAGCYDKPDDPNLDGTASGTGTDGTQTSGASATTASSTSTSGSGSSASATMTTATADSSGGMTTGPGIACGDATPVAGELCLDVAPVVVPVDRNPWDVAIGDIDVDGELDIVTINQVDNQTGSLSVAESDGVGGFAAPDNRTAPPNGYRVQIADGDGDGDDDIVVAGSAIVVWTNNSGAYLYEHTLTDWFGAYGPEVAELLVVDGNGDGVLDIMASEAYSYVFAPGSIVSDRWEFPDGPTSDFPVPGEGAAGIVAAAFGFDGDDDIDAVALNQYYADGYLVANDGAGGFTEAGTVAGCGTSNRHGQAGDLDGDGSIDLLLTCMNGDFGVVLGDGNGGFGAIETYALDGAFRPYLADVDGDGDLDAFVTSTTLQRAALYTNAGDGTLALSDLEFIVGGAVHGMRIGDIDEDGALDVLVPYDDGSAGSVAVWLANP